MIVYDKLWKTLKEKNISQYALIHKYKISTGQLDRLRKNDNISTYTMNTLCTILNCRISDIAEFIMTDEDKEAVEQAINSSAKDSPGSE